MEEVDLRALALEFLGAFVAIQESADKLAHHLIDDTIAPTAAVYLIRRLRLNDDDRWRLISAVSIDLKASPPDKKQFDLLKANRDVVAHRQVLLGDRAGEPVLVASKRTKDGGVEQWTATEAELRGWIADGVNLADEISQLGNGHLYTRVTRSLSLSWDVLDEEIGPMDVDSSR